MHFTLESTIFNVLTGNHDAHAKNFSIIYGEGTAVTGKNIRLAPLYDLVSTVFYPELTPQMAMKIGGEYCSDRLQPRHFEKLAIEAGLAKPMAVRRVPQLAQTVLEGIGQIRIDHPVADKVLALIRKRCESFIRRFSAS